MFYILWNHVRKYLGEVIINILSTLSRVFLDYFNKESTAKKVSTF